MSTVGLGPKLVIGFEMYKPGQDSTSKDEGELSVGKRLFTSVMKRHKNFIDVVVYDALVCNSVWINHCKNLGIDVIVRAKNNNNNSMRLARKTVNRTEAVEVGSAKKNLRKLRFSESTFTMDNVEPPLRFVKFALKHKNKLRTQIMIVTTRMEMALKTLFKIFRWGLIPYWAKDPSIGHKLINARAETVDEKPSFKTCLQRRRCLIVADGFYEWKKEGSTKRPHRITLKNQGLFGFAGLWDAWKSPTGELVNSCTIITTTPNELMEPIHNRMPVILPRDVEPVWLDQSITDSNFLKSLLIPYPADQMMAYEVSPPTSHGKKPTWKW